MGYELICKRGHYRHRDVIPFSPDYCEICGCDFVMWYEVNDTDSIDEAADVECELIIETLCDTTHSRNVRTGFAFMCNNIKDSIIELQKKVDKEVSRIQNDGLIDGDISYKVKRITVGAPTKKSHWNGCEYVDVVYNWGGIRKE